MREREREGLKNRERGEEKRSKHELVVTLKCKLIILVASVLPQLSQHTEGIFESAGSKQVGQVKDRISQSSIQL